MAYKYENPLDYGYKQFKLTKKQHNELFKYRKHEWFNKFEYYYNDKRILIHQFTDWKVAVVSIFAVPILIILHGVNNTKRIFDELIGLFNQKKGGHFTGDSIEKGSETYNKIMEMINEQ